MTALAGRRTRDIAVATEAALSAHANQHGLDVAETRRMFADQQSQQVRMHAENKSDNEKVHARIDRVEAKVDKVGDELAALPWKIIAGMGALLALAATAIGYLVVHYLPLANGG